MAVPVFLSNAHYQKQVCELAACIELVEGVASGIENSLCSARRLRAGDAIVSLGVIRDEVQAAVENLDSAICLLQFLKPTG